ncbi:hypothetical protein ACFC14_02315 [Microbacterium sp. NPDC055988]|uniref:hypothetical protein n=1 Tax=Microbacterium sp. NPDC055988 TaxID=3345671 RepID=UPI0035D81AD2
MRTDRPRGPKSGLGRWITGIALLVMGIGLIVSEWWIRELEMRIATSIADATFATETMFVWSDGNPALGFTMGEGWFAAQATVLCGAALFAGVVAIAGGVLTLLRLVSWPRALTIGAISVVVIFALNQLRLYLAALAMGSFAQQGAHPLDNALGLVGMVLLVLGAGAFYFFAWRAARKRNA